MEKTLLMSLDLGTSFIKSAVYDTTGSLIAVASQPVQDERPRPGVFLQKGEYFVESAISCMKAVCGELGERAADIEAIAFTGQMSGFMGVDKNWNDVTTWSCSLDSRYMPYAQRQMQSLQKPFLEISGTNFPAMAPKYEWFKTEFPEENKRVAKYLMISGYLIGQLGDVDIEDAVIDTTYTTWTGLADITKGKWSDVICGAIGLDTKFLPKIVHSNVICGRLSKKAAQATGLTSGIALVSGAGDKIAGCLGSAILDEGEMNFEASSYGGVHKSVREYRPDMESGRYDCIPSPLPGGGFYAAKFVTGSGITLDWFINTFVRQEGQKLSQAFAQIEKDMESVPPGCNGLMAIGLLSGSAMPIDGTLRGMWMGHDWSHKKEHFYRALLESITFDFELTIDSMDKHYPEHPERSAVVKTVGGGAKSPFWLQLSADVTGKTYQVLSRDDIATWAAAMLAGNAIGVFSDLKETAKSNIHVKKEYSPTPGLRETYRPLKELYAESLVSLQEQYKKIQQVNSNLRV
ncbi:hypothetical protein LJC56_03580 [Christensenellaceae bacterium OttesenSCG-928-K19]|nr:hypothetical protein [Christensenellaceae bacterium OttesenSCG-928-K19]